MDNGCIAHESGLVFGPLERTLHCQTLILILAMQGHSKMGAKPFFILETNKIVFFLHPDVKCILAERDNGKEHNNSFSECSWEDHLF